MEVIPSRIFNYLYMYLDIAYLITLAVILFWSKRKVAFLAGIAGGILYFIVDYGIFYLALGTREVYGGSPFGILLWLSMSYGFTNNVWIWLWLDRDKKTLEWSIIIVAGWIMVAAMAQNFGAPFGELSIRRGTGTYHGAMALILFVGYLIICLKNIKSDASKKIPILWILSIGILVQFAWEFVLLISGIRAQGIMPLIVNSLIETNLGLPFMYFIHKAISNRFDKNGNRLIKANTK